MVFYINSIFSDVRHNLFMINFSLLLKKKSAECRSELNRKQGLLARIGLGTAEGRVGKGVCDCV